MSETPSLSADERAGLERLRSEVATLRSQVQAGLDLAAGLGQPARGPRPLSGPVGPGRPRGNRLTAPCPLTDGGIEALA